MIQLSSFRGGLPLPGTGIVCKNQSARSKTTVRHILSQKLHRGGGGGGDTHKRKEVAAPNASEGFRLPLNSATCNKKISKH